MIKALTVRQPWAHAIVHLGKDVENRSWRTHYRGPLLIHAAARQERNGRELLSECINKTPSERAMGGLPTGCIIGLVDLVDCVRNSKSKWAFARNWHWLLRAPRAVGPLQCAGHLGLWTPPPEVLRSLPKWTREAIDQQSRAGTSLTKS